MITRDVLDSPIAVNDRVFFLDHSESMDGAQREGRVLAIDGDRITILYRSRRGAASRGPIDLSEITVDARHVVVREA